ncbi:MAG: hypothetical protein A2341_21245 [Deltaproteobacteria bacterium RIFOXYB12_FULL_58_9]|nr:MAG: hypothetical protein A2341_21245 [Deltaproteobacteria bacterium RIFOXYB12_FULL_58_9]
MKTTFVWLNLCVAVLVAVTVMLVADSAYAQLDGVADKVSDITEQVTKILRALFILGFVIIGYLWLKGSPEARGRLEKGIIGVIIAGAANEIVNFFMGG